MEIVRFWNMKDLNIDDNNFILLRNFRVNLIERILNECIIFVKRVFISIIFKYI